ncbi:MAG: hypothetical protein IJB89_07685 [Akkermansia sp.]|nr:hypothetical protein [Akkermansia sp.]
MNDKNNKQISKRGTVICNIARPTVRPLTNTATIRAGADHLQQLYASVKGGKQNIKPNKQK